MKRYQFLFEELVKRDFKKKYKRTVLGMAWSLLSPLLTLLVMRLVFTQFFGETMEHYTTYLFCGNLIFACFSESTGLGMTSLLENADSSIKTTTLRCSWCSYLRNFPNIPATKTRKTATKSRYSHNMQAGWNIAEMRLE